MNASLLPSPVLRAWRSLMTALLVVVGLSASSALAAGEVSLLKATSTVGSRYGMQWQDVTFLLLVKNLAYEKQVAVHLKDASGTWGDLAAYYVGPADDGRELWKATTQYASYGTPPEPTRDLEFVLKYTVNGQTYWDNNQGRNYFVAASQGPLLNGTNVLVDSSYLRPYDALEVNVDVQNLAYQKQVKVVYTTDGWATWNEAFASFSSGYVYGYSWVQSPNAAGVERWNLYLPGITAQRVEFAVAYTVDGQTYWDNNFGRNYVVQR